MASEGGSSNNSGGGSSGGSTGSIVSEFSPFDKLTSVHVNCTDDYMLASGYSHNVAMYDLETGAVVR